MALWLGALLLLQQSAAGRFLTNSVARPAEAAARLRWGRAPELAPELRIFALDDGAYAGLRTPFLSGATWAKVLRSIAAARPRAIVTTHMFGTGEFDDRGGELAAALAEIAAASVPVAAATFTSPLAISFREPLPLERAEFALPSADEHATGARLPDHTGFRLYGPELAYARLLTRLGHVAYDGDGRIMPRVKLAAGRAVPHLALAATAPDRAGRVPVDGDGRALLDWAHPDTYWKRTKSLQSLLRDADAGVPARYVDPGSVVLVLTDMYTGKANFVPTPVGPLPGGFVVATALSDALRGEWLVSRAGDVAPTALACLLGLLVALALEGGAFLLVLAAGAAMLPTAGLAAYAFAGVGIGWLPAAAGYAGVAATIHLARLRRRQREQRERDAHAERETAKLNAIVRTAQMFAHDVRKPFSMLNMAIQAIRREKDPARAQSMLDRLYPELARAMTSVEGMIHDVMEIDASAKLHPQATPVEDLLVQSLREVFVIRPEADVALSYDLQHTLPVMVDAAKTRRMMINILDNAVQAMDGKGQIWLRARDVVADGRGFVEVCLGNSDSYIEPVNLARIFEAFYTSGKRGGTGLGLAIAHKVVTDHGGRIRCRSERGLGTEFVFTLPVAEATPQAAPATDELPRTGSELAAGWQQHPVAVGMGQGPDEDQREREHEAWLGAAAARLGRPIKLLLVDDELLYIESLTAQLGGGPPEVRMEWRTALSSQAALGLLAQGFEPDVAFCDIDLGPKSLNGFELVEAMRAVGMDAYVIVHSNRVLPADASKASLSGADAFLPKPARRSRLLEMIREGLAEDDAAPPVTHKPRIAVVDDNVFTLEAWQALVDDAEILTFESPAAFWRRADSDPAFLASLDCIVTDYHFDDAPGTDGADDGLVFAAALKRRVRIPVLLSSDAELRDLPQDVDARMPKEPESYAALRSRLRRGS